MSIESQQDRVIYSARRDSAQAMWATALKNPGGPGGYVAISHVAHLLSKRRRSPASVSVIHVRSSA
ncbi:MAG: hypothetical protein M3P18_11025 [Actinomycetota bacterium]|nr:hypothetical protein [Actinomycetota bacterium]